MNFYHQNADDYFIINSVNSDTGNKYHADKDEIQKLRKASDKLCLEYGLTVVVPTKKAVKPMSAAEYRSADKCQSWKVALAIAIDARSVCFGNTANSHGELSGMVGEEEVTAVGSKGLQCLDGSG